jgi:hypothetical protein
VWYSQARPADTGHAVTLNTLLHKYNYSWQMHVYRSYILVILRHVFYCFQGVSSSFMTAVLKKFTKLKVCIFIIKMKITSQIKM